jgi:hypothetical protein
MLDIGVLLLTSLTLAMVGMQVGSLQAWSLFRFKARNAALLPIQVLVPVAAHGNWLTRRGTVPSLACSAARETGDKTLPSPADADRCGARGWDLPAQPSGPVQ